MAIGVQFLTPRDESQTDPAVNDQRLQEAIQFLSLRLPRRVSPRGIAPMALLQGRQAGAAAGGGVGMSSGGGESPLAQAMRLLAGIQGSGGGTTPQITPGVMAPQPAPQRVPAQSVPMPRTGGIMGYDPASGRFYGTGGSGGIPGGYRRG